ncbi:MAG: cache domain-containing protein [Campylobacterota bacterium]|nr:cache domain-containing protein [Campylobacterota bacterium]
MLTKEKQLKKYILLMITLVIVLIASVRLYIDVVNNKKVFDSKVETVINQIQILVSLEQNKIKDFYTSRASYLLQNKAIIKSIKDKDRDKLYQLILKNYNILKDENKFFSLMHFHLPDGKSFLRMHKRDVYGDNLLEARPIIAHVHKNHKEVDGFEVGKRLHNSEALQYRMVYPIFDADGFYLGALEFGVSSSQIVLATLEILNYTHQEDKNNIQIALLHSSKMLHHEDGKHHLYKIGPYNLAKHSDFFENILKDKLEFSKNSSIIKKDSRTYLLQWNQVLLKNHENKTDGTVLVSFDITKDERDYYNSLFK